MKNLISITLLVLFYISAKAQITDKRWCYALEKSYSSADYKFGESDVYLIFNSKAKTYTWGTSSGTYSIKKNILTLIPNDTPAIPKSYTFSLATSELGKLLCLQYGNKELGSIYYFVACPTDM